MPLHIHVERVDPVAPDHAATDATRGLFARLPRGRAITLMTIALHDGARGPGHCVAPWTVAGLEAAASAAELHVDRVALALQSQPGRTGRPNGPRPSDLGAKLSVDVPGTTTPRAVPTRWIGAHLVLVVPGLAVTGDRGHDPDAGPVHLALRALDQTCQRPGRSAEASAGARLCSSVFASTTLVVDASWWGPLRSVDETPAALTPVGYCAASGSAVPDAAWTALALRQFDAWLVAQIKDAKRPLLGSCVTRGGAADAAWPAVAAPAPVSRRRGLAGAKVAGLWRSDPRRGSARAPLALACGARGELAAAWERWAQRRRPASP